MKFEEVLNSVQYYKSVVSQLSVYLRSEQGIKSDDRAPEIQTLRNILSIQVSSVSKLGDSVWRFPDAQSKQAKTYSAHRFEVDFGAYEAIPDAIMFQAKIAFLIMMFLPRAEMPGARGNKRASGGALKIQTLVPNFRSFFRYLNHVFANLTEHFGEDVVEANFRSFEHIKRVHYVDHSEGFEISRDSMRPIETVLGYIQTKHVSGVLFHEQIVTPKIEQTRAILTDSLRDKREKVLSDLDFEKMSAVSGYVVTDFLKKLGLEIKDRKSNELMESFPFNINFKLVDIDWCIIDTYAMLRLVSKDWPYDVAVQQVKASNLLTHYKGELTLRNSIRDYLKRFTVGATDVNDIRIYLNQVYRSAFFLIAQYTGMRPSELMELRLDKPLVDSFGVPCIVSTVKKHQASERALFDDLWVCTPAMQDAFEALKVISVMKGNPYLVSNADTVAYEAEPKPLRSIKHVMQDHFLDVLGIEFDEGSVYPYVLRHTLAYQLFRADLGLPFISHQLKHFGNLVEAYGSATNRGFSDVTLSYGEIGEQLSGSAKKGANLRHEAEIEAVKAAYDPDATYAGVNAKEHRSRMKKIFQGYMAAGYTKDEIYEAMAAQGIGILNVGTGMCYGGKAEDFDDSIPCIGGLRCNPVRCENAVVTNAHKPKWREVYIENKKVVEKGADGPSYDQAVEAMNEAKMVLDYLETGRHS